MPGTSRTIIHFSLPANVGKQKRKDFKLKIIHKNMEKYQEWGFLSPKIRRIMKLTLAFTLLCIIHISANTYAQTTQVSVDVKNGTFYDVVKQVEKQSEYLFFYNNKDIPNDLPVSLQKTKSNITVILDYLVEKYDLSYKIDDRQIFLTKNTAVQQQQGKRISGIVKDPNGEPIIGANVMEKGTTNGVVTDVEGKFSLNVFSDNATLVISYIGYLSNTVSAKGKSTLDIVLEEDSQNLEEVVITAFGTGQKKESLVGSIQTVRPDDLRVPSSGLTTSFAGRLAGVVAFQRSGQPGEGGSDFYIRGISTLSGITSPLIVLDGIEIDGRELNAIDPEIIESFSILKDATATAMYGTRGANGVMIIKTKSGQASDRPVIGFRVEANVKTPYMVPKVVDGPTYMGLFNEAIANQGTSDKPYSADAIELSGKGTYPYLFPNVDWYDEVFKNQAFNQKANFNIRGGTNKITYFMNLSFNHETGMLKDRAKEFYSYNTNYDMKRYAFQNNIDFHMSKTSTIALHLNADLVDIKNPATSIDGIYGAILQSNPVDAPVYYPNSSLHGDTRWVKWGAYIGGDAAKAINPVEKLTNGYVDAFSSTINANIDFDQKLDMITKGLRFKALLSFKNFTYTNTTRAQSGWNKYVISSFDKTMDGSYEYTIAPYTSPEKTVLNTSTGNGGFHRFYFQTYFDWSRSFGNHSVNAMALFNIDATANNSASDLLTSLPEHKMGYALRISYDWNKRYLLEVNAGYNGSENFAEGHRWGFFPSVAVGWNINEEEFWQPLSDVISRFKLKASYGLVGNDQLGSARFIYLSDINLKGSGSYTTGFGDYSTSYSGPKYLRFQNNDITWEIGKKLNVGLEAQLFHDLNINLDVFKERRENIFQARSSIPDYLGANGISIYGNFATVDNKGVDLSVDYGKQIAKDFSLQFKGTFTFARNKVIEYDEPAGTRINKSMIGKSLNQWMGYVADGLYRDADDIANSATSTLNNIPAAPGDIKYLDQPDNNGVYDGLITTDDMVPLGKPSVPEIVYGFGPSMTYKKWDFSFFFQGVANTSLMINPSTFSPFGQMYHRNVMQFIADDYWSKENPNTAAKYPRLTRDNNEHNNQYSSYWLRNGAFLKLKNVEVGYSFKNCRVYASGENLATFAPFKLWDPEMGFNGATQYPNQRTFNVGIQVSFR